MRSFWAILGLGLASFSAGQWAPSLKVGANYAARTGRILLITYYPDPTSPFFLPGAVEAIDLTAYRGKIVFVKTPDKDQVEKFANLKIPNRPCILFCTPAGSMLGFSTGFATEAELRRNIDQALTCREDRARLEALYKKNSLSPDQLARLAFLRCKMLDPTGVVLLRKAESVSGDKRSISDAYYALANLERLFARWANAQTYIESAIKNAADESQTLHATLLKGVCVFRLGDRKEARQIFEKCLTMAGGAKDDLESAKRFLEQTKAPPLNGPHGRL